MTISERLLPEFEHEFSMTRKMLERIPEDKLAWRPNEKSMTMARLAGHVAEMADWANVTLSGDSFEIASGSYQAHSISSVQDTLSSFDQWMGKATEALKQMKDQEFETMWSLTSRGEPIFTMPRGAVFRTLIMNHMIHHRGQLSVYLRLNGVAIPGMYGPSADEGGPAQA